MKEQIEEKIIEMAKIAFPIYNEINPELLHTAIFGNIHTCKPIENLYNAGYRKQSENVIELPCNIGDSCYPLPRSRKPIVERKVSRITFTKRNIIIGYYENDGQYRPPLRTRTLGEDVFLTKAEAEAKMKGGG